MRGLLAMGAGLFLAGCDAENNDYDFTPAHGMGALIVENDSGVDFDLYLDGSFEDGLDSGDHTTVELEPGEAHVFLREQKWEHQGVSEDVDILEGRRTIVRLYRDSWEWNDYHVTVEYE